MPLYEYKCTGCGHEFEVLILKASQPVACPSCAGAPVERLLSMFAVTEAPAEEREERHHRDDQRRLYRRHPPALDQEQDEEEEGGGDRRRDQRQGQVGKQMRAPGLSQLRGDDPGRGLVPGDGHDRHRRDGAIGTWTKKIDCQEISSVSRPPTAGPRAAPVAPAVAQMTVARRSEPTVAGSSSSTAVTAAAPPRACTQRAAISVLSSVEAPQARLAPAKIARPTAAARPGPTRRAM